jgi:hypothetical protein
MGEGFDRHLGVMQLNTEPVDWKSMDLSYLLQDNYTARWGNTAAGGYIALIHNPDCWERYVHIVAPSQQQMVCSATHCSYLEVGGGPGVSPVEPGTWHLCFATVARSSLTHFSLPPSPGLPRRLTEAMDKAEVWTGSLDELQSYCNVTLPDDTAEHSHTSAVFSSPPPPASPSAALTPKHTHTTQAD